MNLKGGSNNLKVAFFNVENSNRTFQPMECGMLREKAGTVQKGYKGNGVPRGKSDFH